MVGKVLEQARQFIEPALQVVARVEQHQIGAQHGGIVDKAIVQVTFLIGARGIGELVLVHIEGHGRVMGALARKAEQGGEIEHVAGQDQVGRRG